MVKTVYNGNSNKSGVYKIVNITNGRLYVGSAKEFKRRYKGHLKSLCKGTHHNKFLQNDFNKCGSDAFEFHVLEVVAGSKLNRTKKEQVYINEQLDNWENCYNFQKKTIKKNGPWSKTPEQTRAILREQKLGPKNPMYGKVPWNKGRTFPEFSKENHRLYGKHLSSETKEKLSKALMGKSAWNKGKSPGAETRKKISLAQIGRVPWNKGIPCSDEQKKKISQANKGKTPWMKGKVHTEDTKRKMRFAKAGNT